MTFKLTPVIDLMLELYEKPISPDRFKAYIAKLQGNTKGDLVLPISGFNPMAKEHVIAKLKELKSLKTESLISNTLTELNKELSEISTDKTFSVLLNVADDLKGGWTNHYTTDFDSKFKLNALVERNFCTPYFWTSEAYTEELIIQRTKEYAYRTVFWLQNGKIKTLKDYVEQEKCVAHKTNKPKIDYEADEYEKLYKYYIKNQNEDDYNIIFNFMYGDEVCNSLAYPTFGLKSELNGFDFANIL